MGNEIFAGLLSDLTHHSGHLVNAGEVAAYGLYVCVFISFDSVMTLKRRTDMFQHSSAPLRRNLSLPLVFVLLSACDRADPVVSPRL